MLHTTSALGEFESCERRYRYKHVDLIRPVLHGKALGVGTLLHLGLEQFCLGEPLGQSLKVIDAMAADDEFFCSPDGQVELRRVVAMLKAYFVRWEPTRTEWEILAVEKTFEFEIAPGVLFGGKLDLMFRRDGQLFLADHKTTSEEISTVGTDFWQRLAIDKQIVAYSEAVFREYGETPAILWDVVKKPGGKPKMKDRIARRKSENDAEYESRKSAAIETLDEFEDRLLSDMTTTPDEYFVRREIHRTREQHADLLAEVIETCRRIESHSGPWVRNDKACQSRFGTCPYLGVCAGVENLDSERFEKLDTANPELGNNTGGSNELNDCPI